ncbi:MAG TPA: DinB family protein, partial [Chitinophagaceae bacterium]
MKELLGSYAAYNYWANQELMKKIVSLPEAQQRAEVKSSFSSLHATIIHMWDAESIWWQRMKLHENIIVPSLSFHPSTAEAANGLLQQSREWAEWAQSATVPQLEHEFAYQNTKKEKFRQPVWQV